MPLPTAELFHHANEFVRFTPAAGLGILTLWAVPWPSSTPIVFAPPRSLLVTSYVRYSAESW